MAEGYLRIPYMAGECLTCRLANAYDAECTWNGRAITDANSRPVWCPVHEKESVTKRITREIKTKEETL